MEGLQSLDQLKSFFHRGFLIFTNDSDETGIDNRLISAGLRLDMDMSRRDIGMWYLKDEKGSVMRYHPVRETMPFFQKVSKDEGLITRVDFLGGSVPILYEISKSILDAGYNVGIPNLSQVMQNLTIFKKQDSVYATEKVIKL